MVCPNCHSTDIIAVQDQHFCISCGQMVPEDVVRAAEAKEATKRPAKATVASTVQTAPAVPKPSATTGYATIIEQRHRIEAVKPEDEAKPAEHSDTSLNHVAIKSPTAPAADPAAEPTAGKPKPKRKPGRPKATRLDAPKPPADLPAAPKLTVTPIPEPEPTPVEKEASPASRHTLASSRPRAMSDIRPPHPPKPAHTAPKAPPAHKLGVPAIHYSPILAFSLRSRVQPLWLALGAAASVLLAAITGYATWLYLSGTINQVAQRIISGTPQLVGELVVLAALYYIGRSLSQTALIYGLAREADHRPVSLSRQLGIAVNTFTRRLGLDIGYAVLELVILYLAGALVLMGGSHWPIDINWQVVALFSAFLVMLYLLTALALARGLAGVALTLGPHTVAASAKVGWRLFSHRLELVFVRCLAIATEAALVLPIAAVAIALIVASPSSMHVLVALGVGLLALIAGALLGAGTAAWWTALYRRLTELQSGHDPDAPLLSNHQSPEARRGPLTFIVALSTLLLCAALALPWLNF